MESNPESLARDCINQHKSWLILSLNTGLNTLEKVSGTRNLDWFEAVGVELERIRSEFSINPLIKLKVSSEIMRH